MTSLDPEIAQQVVDRTMARLGHNVNVMDARGVIIGSGDQARLGHVHTAALEAIRTRARVVVEEGTAVEGARPGVNLPLLLDGEVLGAVGVTGDPARLGEVADLLAMTAELIVSQVRVQGERDWRTRQRERLVLALVAPAGPPVGLEALAADLGVDLAVVRVAVLVVVPEDDVRRAQHSLDRADPGVLTAVAGRDALLALVPAPARGTDGGAERLLRSLPSGTRPRVHVGGRFDDPPTGGGVPASARSAADVRDLRRTVPGAVHRFDDDPTAALVHGLEDDWRAAELGRPWQRLVEGRALEVSGCDVRRGLGAMRLYVGAVRDGRVPGPLVHVHDDRTPTSG